MRHWRHAVLAAVLVSLTSVQIATSADDVKLLAPPQCSPDDVVSLAPVEYRHRLVQQLSLAEGNRQQWLDLLQKCDAQQREPIAFLLANMPARDLRSLPADFILDDVKLALAARARIAWAKAVPNEIFLNDVLPYANLNERRDPWRAEFAERFFPLVKDCKSAGEAAQVLNREIFKAVGVKYHATKRPKPDQSPAESIAAHYASCSGLAILLVDACRAVGAPARVVGTPLWADSSGNHTWVEVWDGQWRFVGAAEPGPFNKTWFADVAAKASDAKPDDHVDHRIYAASFRQTGLPFRLVWDPASNDYPAVDVTAYYVKRKAMKVATESPDSVIEIRDGNTLVAQATGASASFELAAGRDYAVRISADGKVAEKSVHLPPDADAEVTLASLKLPAPTASPAGDFDGDWAKMKGITPRGYVCYRAPSPIVIDGKGDDAAWNAAPWTEDFVDIEGARRPSPRFRTRAKMLWDDENLYVLAELQEPHVWATITKRNAVIFHDNDFEIFLDPDGDHLDYHEFEVNALNTIWELSLVKPYRDGGPVRDAENVPGLRSAVHVGGTLNAPMDTDRGWSVEVAIPWKGLARYAGKQPCPPTDGERWRLNFSRVEWLVDIIDGQYRKIPRDARPEDNWVWSPTGVIDMHRPERWGYVQFSTATPGAAKFEPDATQAAQDTLMGVYYRQRNFKQRAGHYAASLAELGLTDASDLQLATTDGGYTATSIVDLPNHSKRVLHVREDSRLWEDVATPAAAKQDASKDPVDVLRAWLTTPAAQRPDFAKQPFADAPLTKSQAEAEQKLLWDDHVADVRATRQKEWADKAITLDDHTLRFKDRHFGSKPKNGWNLYISLHGGGGAPAQVNDQQWENQIKLYQPKDSLYIAPRAPTDNWNLWHEPHIDPLFDRLIEDAIVLGDVDPDHVYVMGYSAGGDGVYQLAPRMADRWAAAAMMAGHPNDASPLGLRNIGFALHVGALDSAYNRNMVAAEWAQKLDALHNDDPKGYAHQFQLHEGRAHWMNLEDKVAVDWMAGFTRNPLPDKVVWKQSPVTHDRFYWLGVPAGEAKGGQLAIVSRDGQVFRVEKAEGLKSLVILLNDRMVDLDRPVTIRLGDRELFNGTPHRTIAQLRSTLAERGDPELLFSAAVTVKLDAAGGEGK